MRCVMIKSLSVTLLLASVVLNVCSAWAATEIVPWDRKPGEGYTVDPKDPAANRAICSRL